MCVVAVPLMLRVCYLLLFMLLVWSLIWASAREKTKGHQIILSVYTAYSVDNSVEQYWKSLHW